MVLILLYIDMMQGLTFSLKYGIIRCSIRTLTTEHNNSI